MHESLEKSTNIFKEVIDKNYQELIESEDNLENINELCDQNNKWQCSDCEENFLEFHKAKVHENLRPYTCSHCNGTFKTKSYLKNHFTKVHFQKSENERELPPDLMNKNLQFVPARIQVKI